MSEKRTKTTWLDHPKNVNRLFWGLVAIGVGLTVADLAYHKHALFEWEGWFGFEAFYPGPGVGGHCIPIDPNYLSWVVQSLGYRFRFVE